MEISLNHMDFTDFFYMLIVAKLRFIFFSECFFTNFKKYHKQSRFFGPNHIGPKTIISWILQTSKFKSTTESVWGGTRLIHFDVLFKYLYLLLSQLGHHTNKFTETAPDLFIKYHLKGTICGFMLPRKHLLLILILAFTCLTYQKIQRDCIFSILIFNYWIQFHN